MASIFNDRLLPDPLFEPTPSGYATNLWAPQWVQVTGVTTASTGCRIDRGMVVASGPTPGGSQIAPKEFKTVVKGTPKAPNYDHLRNRKTKGGPKRW